MDSHAADLLRLLLSRLERVPADSHWAHRASGIRGALLEALDQFEAGRQVPWQKVKRLMDYGFSILERAAQEK